MINTKKIASMLAIATFAFPANFLGATEINQTGGVPPTETSPGCSLDIYKTPDNGQLDCVYGQTYITVGEGGYFKETNGSYCDEEYCTFVYTTENGQPILPKELTIHRTDKEQLPPTNNGGGETTPPPTDNGGSDNSNPDNGGSDNGDVAVNDPVSNGDKGTHVEPIVAEGEQLPVDGEEVKAPTLSDMTTDKSSYALEDTITLTLTFNNPDKLVINEITVNDIAYPAIKISDEQYSISIPVSDITTDEGEFLLAVSSINIKGSASPVGIASNNELTITINDFNTAGFIVASAAIGGTAGTAYFVTSTTKGKDLFKKIFRK